MKFLCLPAWLVTASFAFFQGEPEYVSLAGKKYYGGPDARGVIAQAQARLAETPDNIELLVELGLTYGSLKHYRQAIETYSSGIEQKPDWAPLYRHRGHRYITVREFTKAQADLKKGQPTRSRKLRHPVSPRAHVLPYAGFRRGGHRVPEGSRYRDQR